MAAELTPGGATEVSGELRPGQYAVQLDVSTWANAHAGAPGAGWQYQLTFSNPH